MIGRERRRGAVLLLVLAAILLLATTVTLITRRAILSRRSLDSAAAVAQAESVWVTAAEVYRRSGSTADLEFPLPDQGSQSRTAVARVLGRDDGGRDDGGRDDGGRDDAREDGADGGRQDSEWEIEVSIEHNGRLIARRRGTISVAPAANTTAASQEGEGESQ